MISTANSRPVADAGEDFRIARGETALLDGSYSFDPDDDPLSWRWEFVERPAASVAVLGDPFSPAPSFTLDAAGVYRASLVVSDGILESPPDTVRVSTENTFPTADAGPDRAVTVSETVVFDGRGSVDPEDDPLTWRWSILSLPEGSAAVLEGSSTPTPALVPDLEGIYYLSLVVADWEGESDPDVVKVEAGPAVVEASLSARPKRLRRRPRTKYLKVWIEPPSGSDAGDIDPDSVLITAVGTRTLPRPVHRAAAKGARITDRDDDGLPEMRLSFKCGRILKFLRRKKATPVRLEGAFSGGGGFIGTVSLRRAR